jgi:hypothetical protein
MSDLPYRRLYAAATCGIPLGKRLDIKQDKTSPAAYATAAVSLISSSLKAHFSPASSQTAFISRHVETKHVSALPSIYKNNQKMGHS